MDPILTLFRLTELVGLFLVMVAANELCNPAIYRCPGNQIAFKYNKKSDCFGPPQVILEGRQPANVVDCKTAEPSCVCLNVESVCRKALRYSQISFGKEFDAFAAPLALTVDAPTTSDPTSTTVSSISTTTGSSVPPPVIVAQAKTSLDPLPLENHSLCRLPFTGDGSNCKLHKDCVPADSGIALCCGGQCLHVHNVPCVRKFFKAEDQVCSDADYKRLYSSQLILNQDE